MILNFKINNGTIVNIHDKLLNIIMGTT